MFVHEIASIPEGCALRPSRQRGFTRGICEIFTFVHGADPALGPIDRDYLVPKEDPFDVVLAEWRQQA
jgi:hypothetical protein